MRIQQQQFDRKLGEEKKLMQQSLEENIRKSISADFDTQLRLLEQTNKDHEEKLRISREKELTFLQREQELNIKADELELSVQRRMMEERARISEEIRKMEEQKIAGRETEYQLRLKELEKQLEDQKKLAEEMKRRAIAGGSAGTCTGRSAQVQFPL